MNLTRTPQRPPPPVTPVGCPGQPPSGAPSIARPELRAFSSGPGDARRSPGQASGRHRGFSAIELLGVLTIMAILAGMALMSAQQQLKLASRESEGKSLESLADGLTNRIKSALAIPSPADWQPLVAERLGISAAEASINRSGNSRVLLADPAVDVGEAGQIIPLPYAQTVIGSRRPRNVRFILLSSLTDPIPASIATTYGTAAAFSTLWDTAEGVIPANWPSSWKGEVDDLQIRRIDLTGLFHRVVLYNMDVDNEANWTMEAADDEGVADSVQVVSVEPSPSLRHQLGRYGGGLALGLVRGDAGGFLRQLQGGTLVRDVLHHWKRGLTGHCTGSGSKGGARKKVVPAKISRCSKTTSHTTTPPPPGSPPAPPPPADQEPDTYAPRATEMWVLDGTGLSLLDSNGNLAVREVVHQDASYVFENTRWRWHLSMGLSSNNVDPGENLVTGSLAQLVDAFLAAPTRTGGTASYKMQLVENLFLWLREARFWGTEANYSGGNNNNNGNSSAGAWDDRVNDYRQAIQYGATHLE